MTNTKPVHFFDITSTLPGAYKSWSPNTLKVRAVLNFKSIPYTQSWVSYPDIAPLMKGFGVEPNKVGHAYTLPAIVHESILDHQGAMMDSLPIVEHLDHVFPDRPLFPSGDASYALFLAVNKLTLALGPAVRTLIIPSVPEHLDPRGQEYFVRTRSESFGKPLAEVRPTDEGEIAEMWETMEKGCETLIKMLKGREGKKGPFFEGETASYADLSFACLLAFFHRFDREIWEKFMGLGDGEFRALWDATLPWLEGQGEEKEWPIPQDA
ncbi:Glutathione S-transferase-like protein ustS [Penicillium longicatenatum]|uniref:Glutathione S-transferase-like protein ustS n=1 Tax=Penicillium longicatenatum TaxID=1561947 RepID=UPI002548F747|nr:Glutathione S-transferase-like protein ustS [Penicillium longicatenatum]KAJ5639705.1 Glutathione S-transferase-like protein ustS [Penicillium longicatenatum]